MSWRRAVLVAASAGACLGCRAGPKDAADADPLFALGDSLNRIQQYDSARAIWSVALESARQSKDSTYQARILTELGLAHYWLGNLVEARQTQEEALAIKTSLSMGDDALSRSLNVLGLVAYLEGRYPESIALFERAIATARSAGDGPALARASGNIGLPLASVGEFARARAAHRTLRAAGRQLGNPRFEGNGLLNEAMLDNWEGDPLSAIARIDTARALYRKDGYIAGEQFALGQLAASFELMGDLDRAFTTLDSALALARKLELRGEEADNLRLIAGLHAEAGDWRRAIRYFAQADTILSAAGLEGIRGSVLRGEASAYHALHNPDGRPVQG